MNYALPCANLAQLGIQGVGMKSAIIAAACAVLTGCVASNPEAIQATPTPSFGYANLDCQTLAGEDARVAEDLGYLSYRQDRRREMDTLGVIAIGVSPSGLGQADWTAQIAQLKGQREAIHSTMDQKACAQPKAQLDDSTKAKIRYNQRIKAENAS